MAKDNWDFEETNGHDFEMDDSLSQEEWSKIVAQGKLDRVTYHRLNGDDQQTGPDAVVAKGQAFKENISADHPVGKTGRGVR